MRELLEIEVVYASAERQVLKRLMVSEPCTIEQAILTSGILAIYPEIQLENCSVGVFSKIKKLNDLLHSGDRVEIYRPLQCDPKQLRRQKVKPKG